MWPRVDGLRAVELGAPGEMRQWLNDLVLSGRKRATAGLLEGDYRAESEEVEHLGERLALLDAAGVKLAERLEQIDAPRNIRRQSSRIVSP